jgi:hypothetical protein
VKLNDTNYLYKAREHLEMATRLRASARKLKTQEAQAKLTSLASLYEQLSLCYLAESRVTQADRCRDDRRRSIVDFEAKASSPPALLGETRPFSDQAERIGATYHHRH